MYIRGLIPRNSTELAEAVPIAISHADVCSGTSGLNWVWVFVYVHAHTFGMQEATFQTNQYFL